MDKYIKVIKENWEAAVLAATCVLAVLSIVVFFCGGREEENVTATSRQQLVRQKALSDKAFAFLKPKAANCPRNPFELAVKKPEPPKPKPAPPPPPEKKVEAPVVVEPVKEPEPPKEEPVTEVVAEPPKPQPVVGTFEFVFQRRNSDGKTVAVIRTQLRGEALNGQTVGVGDVINGVKVLAISEDRIGLQDARGQRGTIPLGEKRNVIFCK